MKNDVSVYEKITRFFVLDNKTSYNSETSEAMHDYKLVRKETIINGELDNMIFQIIRDNNYDSSWAWFTWSSAGEAKKEWRTMVDDYEAE